MEKVFFKPTSTVDVKDQSGNLKKVEVSGEHPLTVKVDNVEIVTLMTLGTHPKALSIGYLRNQRLISSINDIAKINIDLDRELVEITTKKGINNLNKKLSKRIVTSGCGQGTMFSCTIDEIYASKLNYGNLNQSTLYKILSNLSYENEIYRKAGAVHSCALCTPQKTLIFIEDVGRHNAADTIAGIMWLEDIKLNSEVYFYTTGRITSEIVIKVAQMGISYIISRSGITQMGLELAQDLDMIMLSRAKGKHFLLYSGFDRFKFDTPK